MKRVETAIAACAVAALGAFIVWICLPIVARGLSNVDDGFFSLAAKALVFGKGYGIWLNDGKFSPFDPYNGLGPMLILPIAAITWLFGTLDWLPGAATGVMFLGEMLGAVVLLASRIGWARACGFIFFILLFLALGTSRQMWLFGVLIGEPFCFGFFLIAVIVLSTPVLSRRDAVLAGVFFGLSFLTKQMAVFACLGAIGAWVLTDRLRALRNAPYLILGGASPLLAFEAYKLISLGWKGYLSLWSAIIYTSTAMASSGGDLPFRTTEFLKRIQDYYQSPTLIGTALLVTIGAVASFRHEQGRTLVWRMSLFAIAGCIAHMTYALLVSPLWARYLWIGVAAGCAAIAAALMLPGSRFRIAAVTGAGMAMFAPALYEPIVLNRNFALSMNMWPRERAEAVAIVDSLPQLPLASQNWNSFDDVLYLARGERRAVYEPSIKDLVGHDFLSIVNTFWSDSDSPFVESTVEACDNAAPKAEYIRIYRCTAKFWDAYQHRIDAKALSPATSSSVVRARG